MSKQQDGGLGEALALEYLEGQGLHLVTKNFRCEMGEIDLILKEGKTFVFVEVKVRADETFASVLEQIKPQQCQRIRRCAQFFLITEGLNEHYTSMRFDVVALVSDYNSMQWLPDAF
ncbi:MULTISPECIES: YraN family protein [Idiomarina]|uniref:YraN family protein n=1 Tax=Idiomarinaceae TaxID=267893 RepID=UPI00129C434A|nr:MULTISPECIES: YraN family protein [Idiomarina]MRJ41988.1 YraN family protein [Idiomarina sp. FeN1]NCU57271.1 YraN family protein [Idiomarina sp. FenA--70]NCU59979.1 YraN family protein [Idiomarina sp. FenBw--71]UUN12893.1 YraN family protein [Idiomarina loihiensis]